MEDEEFSGSTTCVPLGADETRMNVGEGDGESKRRVLLIHTYPSHNI